MGWHAAGLGERMRIFLAMLLGAFVLSGCTTTDRNVLTGAGVGAGVGALIGLAGGPSGPAIGAAIGGGGRWGDRISGPSRWLLHSQSERSGLARALRRPAGEGGRLLHRE